LLLGFISFEALFTLAAASGVLAMIYVYRLREPRHLPSPPGAHPGIITRPEEHYV
jgi:hypothetical protein